MSAAYTALKICGEPNGANFVFLDEDKAVGLMRIFLKEDKALIDKVVFLPEIEEGDKKFFVHVMLLKLHDATPLTVRFEGEIKELLPYGFHFENGDTEAFSKDINVHTNCSGKNDETN